MIKDWFKKNNAPFLIAGPCSVESESQMMETALEIEKAGRVSALRGGVWKPRTQPGNFEGIGAPALQWLKAAGERTAMPVMTEVANANHVEEALKAGIDMLWLGARTTVNPFYVQEIADALKGTEIPVLIKNPIHPDISLWMGAVERINKAGISNIAAVHRGFYAYKSSPFRNEPKWEVFFELKRLAPELPVLCDPSHIAGKRELLQEVCQSAADLGMDGLMIESHLNPEKALSDSEQQLTPSALSKLLNKLEWRKEFINDQVFIEQLEELRSKIDTIDARLLEVLKQRMDVVEEIGEFKELNHVTIFQLKRWFTVLKNRQDLAGELGINDSLAHELFQLIHKYSIDQQIKVQQRTSV